MPTERLYYHDSHLTEFDAQVVRITQTGDGRAAIVLDRTAFYPTGGGQPFDTGTLDGTPVVECLDLESEGVLHVLAGAVPDVGARVRGVIDWSRRLDHLQQHTGQHLLSQAFVTLFGAPTCGFRMMEHGSEIDVELSQPTHARIEQAIDLANRVIWEDRPLRIFTATPEEAARLPLRRDSTRTGDLRLVEIEGFDVNACGGTHARRTGEVGLIAARAWERAKGMTRIEFIAGSRALADYRRANATARQVAAHFGVARDDAPAAAACLQDELKALQRRLRPLEELAARAEAEALINTATHHASATDGTAADRTAHSEAARDATELVVVVHVFSDRDAEALKRIALAAVAARTNTVALFAARDAEQARLVFARAPDAPGDMNALMQRACALLEGRGGGRPDLAQGGGRRLEKLSEALHCAASTLTNAPARNV